MVLFSSLGDSGGGLSSRILFTIYEPVLNLVGSITRSASGAWDHYIALTRVSRENERRQKEISELREQLNRLRNHEQENARLRKLLDLKAGYRFPTLAAQVIGEDVTGYYRSVFINRGSADGALKDMPIVVATGLVGRITRSSSGMAQALLIIDPALSVDCRVVRTRDRAILSGAMERGCALRFIDRSSTVRKGDSVVTSGLDGVFPKGLMIGEIREVGKASGGLFLEAEVKPSVDFSKLEEVLVILRIQRGFDIGPDTERLN